MTGHIVGNDIKLPEAVNKRADKTKDAPADPAAPALAQKKDDDVKVEKVNKK